MHLTPAQALHRGVAAHNEGNLHDAEACYRAIIKSHKKKSVGNQALYVIAQCYINLGILLHGKGDLKETINCYRSALKIRPDFIEIYWLKGLARRDMGDLKRSLDCYQQAVRLEPNNADAHNNLGAAQQHKGDLEGSIQSYRKALKIDPACVEAYNNMGGALQGLGDTGAALESYKQALKIKPDYANGYINMGCILHDTGNLEAAIDCYKNAIKIMPGSTQAHNNMGNALKGLGNYEKALEHFDYISATVINPSDPQFWYNSKSLALECLYFLGRYAELEQRLNVLANSGEINLRIAAVSAFVTNQLGLADPYPFCKNPLDFFHVSNLNNHVADVSRFAEALMLEAANENAVWEPQHGVTRSGFQTSPTIFSAGKNCQVLEIILRKEIESYHSKFKSEDCDYMKLWPAKYDIRGWFVRLLKTGYQQAHNHPSGWLSGVVYLKTIDSSDTDEGSIELGLHGHDLPILDDSYARKIHHPKVGDIILFPSSLFHRTIPFSEDTERCVIAFDIYRYIK